MSKTVVNKQAPSVSTKYDLTGERDNQSEYYRLKLEELRMANMAGSDLLSSDEQKALKSVSDLDGLTTKILVRLKVLSDYDPVLNTMRALTGHEERMDIARELATRHYNKTVTDHFVGQFVTTQGSNDLLFGALATSRSALSASTRTVWGTLSAAVGGGGGGAA